MKIHQLRFKNLNSLEGEWNIDFTAPEFESEGIFVITGPTGVGKTTILDAICLALYGSTPRLDTITASSNDIMSRQTGECFAEVTFSTIHGTYKCHWSQRRSRGKANGKLQSAKHEISDSKTGDVLENQLRAVKSKVEEVSGMDFGRFTRSVMLAQGNFAKFLQSSADERSPILEQITGTSIYSEISKLVHQRKSNEESRLKEHIAQMSGIQILDEEAEESLKAETQSFELEHKQKAAQLDAQRKAEQWLFTLEKEQATIETAASQQQEILKKVAEFQPQATLLTEAEKAHDLETEYVKLTSLKQIRESHQTKIAHLLKLVEEQSKTAEESARQARKFESALTAAKQQAHETEPKLIKARELDTQNKGFQHQIDALSSQWKKLTAEQAAIQSKIDQIKSNQQQIEAQEKDSLAFLETHKSCANLSAKLSGIVQQSQWWKERIAEQSTAEQQLKEKETQISQLKADQAKESQILDTAKKQLESSASSLASEKTKLSSILGEESLLSYEKQLTLLEDKFLLEEKIVSLENERSRLVANSPCPLCGSKSHPFADGEPPARTDTEKEIIQKKKQIKEIQTLEKSIQSWQLDFQKKQAAVNQSQEHLTTLEKQLTQELQSLQNLKTTHTNIAANCKEVQQKLTTSLTHFLSDNTLQITLETIDPILEKLQILQTQWANHSEVIEKANDQKIKLRATLESEIEKLNTHAHLLESVKSEGEKLRKKITDNKQSTCQLIGETSIEKLEASLKQAIHEAERSFKKSNEQRETANTELSKLKAQHSEISKQEQTTADLIKTQRSTLLQKITAKGFGDLEAFLSARMEETKRQELKAIQQNLIERKNELASRLRDAQERLKSEKEKQLTTHTREEIAETIKTLTDQLKETSQLLGAKQEKLKNNEAAKSQIAEKLTEKEKLEKELARWRKLHGLIGSSDGKKFRNFAQGLTFEIMVRHANHQLGKMSDRYQLIRDLDAPLDLNVIDSYQAGEIRSTKNLSGGESFIISLALALGLSQMASQTVRVDSLFLDEGFGTLDEESLETALETLSSLNREGKLIGIISHISALKERIPTQLNLSPTQQGKATITGPGVESKG